MFDRKSNCPTTSEHNRNMADLELITQFLAAKGYSGALSALQAESASKESRTDQETELEKIIKRARVEATADAPTPYQQHLAIATISETAKVKPELYSQQYALLVDWISGSLERHKPELRGVLFPLFAHCYFGLVRVQPERSTFAHQFLQRWGVEHAESYGAEVRALGALTRREDLLDSSGTPSTSPSPSPSFECLAHLQGSNKRLRVTLDVVTHELLKSFLAQNKLLLLVGLLNNYVDLVIEDREPRPFMEVIVATPPGGAVGTVGGGGAAAAAAASLHPSLEAASSLTAEVNWGVLPLPLAGAASRTAAAVEARSRPQFTILGGTNEAVPYPKLSTSTSLPTVGDLVSSARLHPQPAFPPGETHLLLLLMPLKMCILPL
jgi:hypothetical protein